VLAKVTTFLEREKKTKSKTFFDISTTGNLD